MFQFGKRRPLNKQRKLQEKKTKLSVLFVVFVPQTFCLNVMAKKIKMFSYKFTCVSVPRDEKKIITGFFLFKDQKKLKKKSSYIFFIIKKGVLFIHIISSLNKQCNFYRTETTKCKTKKVSPSSYNTSLFNRFGMIFFLLFVCAQIRQKKCELRKYPQKSKKKYIKEKSYSFLAFLLLYVTGLESGCF